ncbi:MAG: hypothetical protein HRT44_06550 [Bdellovibrionales bacterium]|nr:hypothetical protein [Bdellovibrionales bacterium]NQZ18901.1 hypothetical protein [Bdellovibrionales bacterium]
MKKKIAIFILVFGPMAASFLFLSGKFTLDYLGGLSSDVSKKEASTDFLSYMTRVNGVRQLQLAKLDQMEVLTKKSRKLIFWNKLELPPVVVALEVPVQYSYYVDLKKNWRINQTGGAIEVIAPPLEFNPPAAKVSEIQFRLEKKSIFRNEENVKNSLLKDLSPYLETRAQEQASLVRETARRELQELVQLWYKASSEQPLQIVVLFADEVEDPQSDQK